MVHGQGAFYPFPPEFEFNDHYQVKHSKNLLSQK